MTYLYSDSIGGEYTAVCPEDAGTYYVKAYVPESGLYKDLESAPTEFSILQCEYIMNMIRFESSEIYYDGKEKGLEIGGTLPVGVQVSYIGNGKTDAGTYTVTAKFTGDSNHKAIPDRTAELTILPVRVEIPETRRLIYTGDELSVLEGNELFDVVSGSTGTEIGAYEMVLALKDVNNSIWVDGTTGNQTIKWEIVNARENDDPKLPDEKDTTETEVTTENPVTTEQSVTEEKTTETSQIASEEEQLDSEDNPVSSEGKEVESKTTDEKKTEEQVDILKPEEVTETADRVTTEGKTEKQADISKSEEATDRMTTEVKPEKQTDVSKPEQATDTSDRVTTEGETGEKRTTQETTITENKDAVPVQSDEEKKTLPADQVTEEMSQDVPGTMNQGTSTEENRDGNSTSGKQEKNAEEKETQKPVEQKTQQNTTESAKTVPATQGSTEKAVQRSTQTPVSSSNVKTTQGDKKTDAKRTAETAKQIAETTEQDEGLDVGDTVEVGIYRYTVTDDGEVAITGMTNNKAKKVIIPDTITIQNQTFAVTEISDGAFANSSIVKVAIGNNVKTIGASSFKNCKKLSSVTLGKNVDTIGKNAFKNCKALKKIVLPENLEEIGNSAFSGCKKLANITIKSSKLLIVEKNAFKGIKKTAKIKVPRKKLSKYKKLLKNKGQSRTVKIR